MWDMWLLTRNTGGGKHQAFTKLLSLFSEISETPISHGNSSLKIMCKIPKKYILVAETIYCNKNELVKIKLISFTFFFVTITSFLHTKFFFRVYVRDTHFIEKNFCLGQKFLSAGSV